MSNLNLNKVILGGRLTADPELKQTQSGLSVCSFTIAITRKANKDETDFIRCTAWRNTADFISRYFKKGSSICVVGAIQTRSWTDQNNQKQYSTEVLVDEALFVDSKSEGGNVAPTTSTSEAPVTPKFEEIKPDDDLPF